MGHTARQACCTVSHTSSGSSGRWSFPPPSRGAGGRPGCRTRMSSRCVLRRRQPVCVCVVFLCSLRFWFPPRTRTLVARSSGSFSFLPPTHPRSFRLTEAGLPPCSCSNCTCIITYSARVECVLGRGWRGLMRGCRPLTCRSPPPPPPPRSKTPFIVRGQGGEDGVYRQDPRSMVPPQFRNRADPQLELFGKTVAN